MVVDQGRRLAKFGPSGGLCGVVLCLAVLAGQSHALSNSGFETGKDDQWTPISGGNDIHDIAALEHKQVQSDHSPRPRMSTRYMLQKCDKRPRPKGIDIA